MGLKGLQKETCGFNISEDYAYIYGSDSYLNILLAQLVSATVTGTRVVSYSNSIFP